MEWNGEGAEGEGRREKGEFGGAGEGISIY
jgi:hypothetical protein